MACSSAGEQATVVIESTTTVSHPVTHVTVVPTTAPTTTAVAEVDPGDLEGWELIEIKLGSLSMVVALADDVPERSRGLMGVENLGDLAGMLFEYSMPSRSGFWMQGTVIPLDIAFFTAEGVLVDAFEMEPCDATPCPMYYSRAEYQWALETPAGRLAELGSDVRLVVGAG